LLRRRALRVRTAELNGALLRGQTACLFIMARPVEALEAANGVRRTVSLLIAREGRVPHCAIEGAALRTVQPAEAALVGWRHARRGAASDDSRRRGQPTRRGARPRARTRARPGARARPGRLAVRPRRSRHRRPGRGAGRRSSARAGRGRGGRSVPGSSCRSRGSTPAVATLTTRAATDEKTTDHRPSCESLHASLPKE
jgi:hypothetical protein